MKLHYPTWLKRILLPYEFPDHPLYSDPNAPAAEAVSENAEPDEAEEGLRHILGNEFVDKLNRFCTQSTSKQLSQHHGKLLTAASIVMMASGQAMAVDYAQCEAMQNAKTRLEQSPAIRLEVARAELAASTTSGFVSEWDAERLRLEARKNALMALRAGRGTHEAVEAMKKIQAVEADMQKAGCP